jgi:hypothetical protein
VQTPRDFLQPQVALLLAQGTLNTRVISVTVPHAMGPRVDEIHHAVDMRVILVLVGDDYALVLRKAEVI